MLTKWVVLDEGDAQSGGIGALGRLWVLTLHGLRQWHRLRLSEY